MSWGCGTPGNRVQWALFSVLSLLWIVLWSVSKAQRNKCQLCSTDDTSMSDCTQLRSDSWNDFDEATQGA
jgi:hypothetical protein